MTFTGSIIQLYPHNGWPTVEGFDFSFVNSLADATLAATDWWGIGIECVSQVLIEGLGRTDAAEVYFNVFTGPDGQWTISYNELFRAFNLRLQLAEAAQNLTSMQLRLCEAGGFGISIYDEENHSRAPVPTLRNAEVAVKRIANDPKRGYLSVVVSSKLMSYERACSLAGPRAEEVKLSIAGYVLFPFFAPTVGRG
ncbi:hypothetical protein DB30_02695 [Enhygromyxa salina]|uniref:Uncharacterized protein n=2 Tax=Enhygromyxa salina TaxID=215803 RepID=A0A0C1ZP91_9BACT|nr:hypothetical protein DB30_02695 [Enhygromyxa salina]